MIEYLGVLRALARKSISYMRRNQVAVVPILAIACSVIIFRQYLFAGTLLYGDANFMWTHDMLRAELWQMLNFWRVESGGVSGAIANVSQSWILAQALVATGLLWAASELKATKQSDAGGS